MCLQVRVSSVLTFYLISTVRKLVSVVILYYVHIITNGICFHICKY